MFAEGRGTLVAISSFYSLCEQDILDICLEAGTTYFFSVKGPFTVSLIGYTIPKVQPDVQLPSRPPHSLRTDATGDSPRVESGPSTSDNARIKPYSKDVTSQKKQKKGKKLSETELPAKRKAEKSKPTSSTEAAAPRPTKTQSRGG
ncbi:hypothetical protein FA13DRAFT_1799068 [Coprinellus micaceus]|uniref:Nucleoplasmin-like domain-containing protein n=1 Tax=Coprinellus micaceus TaxID=71717 RepID=A0A4Y7SM15_COPMI|nr:hypothetical protein FA13DRAFT_1799068 [Coprinellus micaceus]